MNDYTDYLIDTFFDLPYARIHITSFGRGKPLLLLPPWPFTGRMYALLAPYIADEYSVTALDFPSWAGRSKYNYNPKSYSVSQYVKLVVDSIDILYPHNNHIAIGGISIGGTVALLATYFYPSKIDTVLPICSPYEGTFMLKDYKVKPKLMSIARRFTPLGIALKKYYVMQLQGYKKRLPEKMVHELKKDYKNLHPKAALDFALDFFHADYSDIFKNVNSDVTVVGCRKDKFIHPHITKTLANTILPRATYVEVQSASHYLITENTQKLAEIITHYV
jgi:pimeloyl-ACP methyl ester carboxylesterase